MLSDTDAGNVVVGAQAGAQWGYRLLPLLLFLIPMLYMVQELTVRLGIYTGRGFGELVRERFGMGWAWTATIALALLAIVATGSYRRVERILVFVGLFELAFFFVAWSAHPSLAIMSKDVVDLPIANRQFTLLVAAIVGAVFSPWMIFYQQSAFADKNLSPGDIKAARWDTAIGAVLTQCLTGAILIAAAALASRGASPGLHSVGEISRELSTFLGERVGRMVFSFGVLGASMVAAIVSSLALTWGVSEVTGHRRSLEHHPFGAKWFYAISSLSVIGAAARVWSASELGWLTIAAQVVNVFLLPLVIVLLIALAVKVLPKPLRPHGLYLWSLIGVSSIVIAAGLVGAGLGQNLTLKAPPQLATHLRTAPSASRR
ncbi:MAG: divalent metal cation transporter [Terracidiphilus sp.]